MRKTFWAFGLAEGFEHDDGFFDHTGFIYDGEFDDDPPRGTRKLAYHAYRKMTELLEGADWSRVETLSLGKDVHAIRVPRGKGTVTVLWHDPPYPVSAMVPPKVLHEMRRRLERLGRGVTNAGDPRDRFGAFRDIISLGLAAGGPPAVEGWAPPERVRPLEERILGGAADASAELEALIDEAREALR